MTDSAAECRESLRSIMPIVGKWAYFDHAAVAPLPAPTSRVLARFAKEAAEEGDTVWPAWSRAVELTRKHAAELIQANSDEIALVPNTTWGINLVAAGIPWQAGDRIAVPSNEFPSNLLVWRQLEDRGVAIDWIESDETGCLTIDRIADAIRPATRLLAISWVGFASGYRIDPKQVAQVAHERGCQVFLDAIQGLGVFPLDVHQSEIDYLAGDGHKWMLGPEGAGFLYVRRERLETLRPWGVGWNSVRQSYSFAATELNWKDSAGRFEGGSYNMAGLIALGASLRVLADLRQRFGQDSVAKAVLENAQNLRNALSRVGARMAAPYADENQSGIVSFDLPGVEPAAVREACLKHGVVVSCRLGKTRASTHAYNNTSDIDRLVSAVDSMK